MLLTGSCGVNRGVEPEPTMSTSTVTADFQPTESVTTGGELENTPPSPETDLALIPLTWSDQESVTRLFGSWEAKGTTLTLNRLSGSRSYISANDIYVPEGEDFSFSATVSALTESEATAELLFCGSHPQYIDTSAVSLRVEPHRGTVILSCAGKRLLKEDLSFTLEDEFLTASAITVKAERKNGLLTLSINGQVLNTEGISLQGGGYFGLASNTENTCFSNLTYTVGSMKNPISLFRLTDGNTVRLKLGRYRYEYNYSESGESIRLEMVMPAGCTLTANGNLIGSGSCYVDFTPGTYGENHLLLEIEHPDYGETAVSFVVMRKLPKEQYYSDTYRPTGHFTSDTLSLTALEQLYYESDTGEYHLICKTVDDDRNAPTLGHYVSDDLVSWERRAMTVYGTAPARIAACVWDLTNSSGLVENGGMVMLGENASGVGSLFYSVDGGFNWFFVSELIFSNATEGLTHRVLSVVRNPADDGWLMLAQRNGLELYASADLKQWSFQSAVEGSADVLIPLVQGQQTDYLLLSEDGNRATLGNLQKLGGLYCFVTSQTLSKAVEFDSDAVYLVHNGQTLMVRLYQELSASMTADKQWNGVLSAPVALTADGGVLRQRSTAENLMLGETILTLNGTQSLGQQNLLAQQKLSSFQLDLALSVKQSSNAVLKFRVGENEETVLSISMGLDAISLALDTRASSTDFLGSVQSVMLPLTVGETLTLSVSVDNSLTVISVNGGEAVLYAMIFPEGSSNGMSLTSGDSSAELLSLTCREYVSILPEKPNMTISIGTYNIQYGLCVGVDYRIIAEEILASGVSIVGLQEIDYCTVRNHAQDTMALLSEYTGWEYYAFAPALENFQGGQYGVAILSKYPILSNTYVPLPALTEAEERRTVQHAVIDIDGYKLDFFNTHCDTDSIHVQLAAIKELIDPNSNFVITGDFNHGVYRSFTVFEGTSLANTMQGSGKGYIDNIVLSRNIICNNLRIDFTQHSDHEHVVAELEFFN